MNAIDWSALNTVNDWAAALNSILDEAQAAVTARDTTRMEAAVRLLGTFQDESPNATCRTLDRIAQQAVKDLMAAAFGEAVDGIASRSAELTQYIKDMQAITDEAAKSSSLIRLDRAKKATDAAASVIEAAVQLRGELSNNTADKDLAAKIEAAIAAVQKMRSAVETANHG